MGVLLVPSSSPTLSPIYDGLDVNVTSIVTWFHLNHDMVSRRIYKLPVSFYGGHSITVLRHSISGITVYSSVRVLLSIHIAATTGPLLLPHSTPLEPRSSDEARTSQVRPVTLDGTWYRRSPRWRIRLSSSLVQVSFVSSNPPKCILV